jgi:hypothetical protein
MSGGWRPRYLSGRISLLPDAVEALRRLGLVGEPPEEHDPFNP